MGHEDQFPLRRLTARSVIRKRTVAATRGNGRDAPIPAVHATTTEPLEPTAAIQAGARSRGAGHHLGAASTRSSNIILATGSVGASARMS